MNCHRSLHVHLIKVGICETATPFWANPPRCHVMPDETYLFPTGKARYTFSRPGGFTFTFSTFSDDDVNNKKRGSRHSNKDKRSDEGGSGGSSNNNNFHSHFHTWVTSTTPYLTAPTLPGLQAQCLEASTAASQTLIKPAVGSGLFIQDHINLASCSLPNSRGSFFLPHNAVGVIVGPYPRQVNLLLQFSSITITNQPLAKLICSCNSAQLPSQTNP